MEKVEPILGVPSTLGLFMPFARADTRRMLSDNKPHKKSPLVRSRKDYRAAYADSQKLEAVKLWLVCGNMPVVSATLGIPLPTIKQWRYSKWWGEIVAELKTEDSIKLSKKLQEVANKALAVVEDRLDNGDWIYDQKLGEMRRKPVSSRDAYQITAGVLDRHLAIERKPQEDANQQKIADRLESIAATFASFARKTTKIEVVDVVDVQPPDTEGEVVAEYTEEQDESQMG